jgi:chromate transporter
MTAEDFSALFALGQAAPGPNPDGGHPGGLACGGLLGDAGDQPGQVRTVVRCITIVMLHVWERFKDKPGGVVVQAGLLPVTRGLVAASALLIAQLDHPRLPRGDHGRHRHHRAQDQDPSAVVVVGGALAGFFYLGTF